MKIALCLSGQARSVKAGYEFHKRNILDGTDVTVFIHTWTQENMNFYQEIIDL